MRVLIFTDTHVCQHNEFSTPTEDGLTTYLHEVKDSLMWVGRQILRDKPDLVVFCGDYFHFTGIVDTRSLSVGSLGLTHISMCCAEVGAPLYLITGNHDVYDSTSRIHNLEIFQQAGTVIDSPQTVDYKGQRLAFLPWTSLDESRRFISAIQADAVFSHAPIIGSELFVAEVDGKKVPKLEKAGLALSEFAPGTLIFNGHYHKPGYAADTDADVGLITIGSLLSRTFHDINSPPRGIVLFDTETREYKRVDNPYSPTYAYIDPTNVPASLDLSVTNATVFVTPETRDQALKIADQCKNYRFQYIAGATEASRDEKLTAKNTRADNLSAYLESRSSETTPLHRKYLDRLTRADLQSKSASKLAFKAIKAENLLSIGNISYNFSLGLTLLNGDNRDDRSAASNGSGKTAISLEALHWLLTGSTLRKASTAEVVREGARGALVSLDVDINGTPYTITRTRNHPEHGTGVRVFQGSEDISARKTKDSQAKIEQILGVSTERLFQTILLTNDSKSRFSDLTPGARLQVLEEALSLQEYADLREVCKEDLKKLSISSKEADYRSASGGWRSAADMCHGVQLEASVAKKQIEEGKAAQLKADIKDMESSLSKARELIAESRATTTETPTADIDRIKEKHQRITEKIYAIDAEIQRATREIASLKKVTDKCPTCGQSLGKDLGSVKEKISKETSELRHNKESKATLQSRLSGLKTRITEWEAAELQSKQRLDKMTRKAELLDSEIRSSRAQLSVLSDRVSHLQTMADRAVSTLAKHESDVEDKHQELLRVQQSAEVISWWVAALGPAGIRSFLVDAALHQLNIYLERNATTVLGEQLGTPRLSGSKEKKSGGVTNQVSVELSGGRSIGLLSSGQRRRCDILLQLALNWLEQSTLGAGTNLVVCDEVLDPIDEHGCAGVIDLLRDMSLNKCVIVTSHNAWLKSMPFDRRWTACLENGTTTLINEGF